MKTTKRLLLCLAWLLVAGYCVYTTVRIRQLEARLRHPPAQLSYAFDDSFMRYFGQPGVDAVDGAVRRGVTDPDQLAREVTRELKQK
jgi:hypothetical protein